MQAAEMQMDDGLYSWAKAGVWTWRGGQDVVWANCEMIYVSFFFFFFYLYSNAGGQAMPVYLNNYWMMVKKICADIYDPLHPLFYYFYVLWF